MITNRIIISEEATDKLKQLKNKLKIGPMYSIARMGFCYSLNDERPPQVEFFKEDGMEFNRTTLLGEFDPIYMVLLKKRGFFKLTKDKVDVEAADQLSPKLATSYLSAHINRGIIQLHTRIKNQEDLKDIILELRH